MDEELAKLLKAFKTILKLKLRERYHEKFDECIQELCDIILNKLDSCTGDLNTLLKLNIQALRSSLEFKYKSNSKLYGFEMIRMNNEQLNVIKSATDAHLTFYDVEIEAEEKRIKQIRYIYIIKQNCKGLIKICNLELINQIIQLKDHFIKHNCASLYEIISARMLFKKPHPRIDILMRHHANALTHVLKMKMDSMDHMDDQDKESNKILKMHSKLYEELNIYLDASLY